MDVTIATPRHVDFGTKDESLVSVRPVLKLNPQFVPNFRLNSPKGDYRSHHVTGGEANAIFGVEALRVTSDYANHASVLCNSLLVASGNSVVITRLPGKVVDGAGFRPARSAKKTFYLAYFQPADTEHLYVRDINGNVEKDVNGDLVLQTSGDTVDIYRSALVSKYVEDTASVNAYTETIDGVEVKFVPIFTGEAEGHGSYYNNYGFGFEALIEGETNVALRDKKKALSYVLRTYDKETGSKKILETIEGSKDIEFTFKPYASDPLTNKGLTLPDGFPGLYGNYIDPAIKLQGYTFRGIKMYDDAGIALGFKAMLENENAVLFEESVEPILPTLADFPVTDTNEANAVASLKEEYKYMVNFLSKKYTAGIEWETLRHFTSADVVNFKDVGYDVSIDDRTIPTYLENGEDGIIDDVDVYEEAVVDEFARYADPDDIVNSIPINRDTIFLDSGFKFERKLSLAPYISNRTDTIAGFSTYSFNVDNVALEVSDDLARGNMLRSVLGLYTESKTFGTPTMRAFVLMGSGMLSNKLYRYRMPMMLDWGVKAIRYYGSLDGKWKEVHAFSRQDKSMVTELIDIEPKFIKPSIKDKLWQAGLNWIDNENEIEFYYSGGQTIYPYDGSVLNSISTVIAAATIHRRHDKIQRIYSGVDDMTNTQLKVAAERDMEDLLSGAFGTAIMTRPEVYYLQRDIDTGWSFRLKTDMYANGMKTVMYSEVIAHRMSDFS